MRKAVSLSDSFVRMFGIVTTIAVPFPISTSNDLTHTEFSESYLHSYPRERQSLLAPATTSTSSFARSGLNRGLSGVSTTPTPQTETRVSLVVAWKGMRRRTLDSTETVTRVSRYSRGDPIVGL